jgi:hypothetical protein
MVLLLSLRVSRQIIVAPGPGSAEASQGERDIVDEFLNAV